MRHAFGGEAVTFFTFTGPFLGDATKAVLLKRNVPLAQGASAVIIDNLLYYASVIMIVLAGIASLLYLYGSNSRTMSNVLTSIVVFSIIMFAALVAIVRFGVKPISWVLKKLEDRGRLPKFILRREHHLMEVETNVFDFYNTRRGDFFAIFGISMSVHVISVCEVYLALKFLEGQAFVSTAFIIESLTKVINAVFSFIPGTIGVYEGGERDHFEDTRLHDRCRRCSCSRQAGRYTVFHLHWAIDPALADRRTWSEASEQTGCIAVNFLFPR